MTIEKLHAMPNHTKGDDGYFYDAKYIGKTYQFENKIIHFNDRSFFEMPYEVVRTIIQESSLEFKKEITELKSKLESIEKDYNSKIIRVLESISNYAGEIDEINSNVKTIKDNIETTIDNKLNDVYKSFEKLSQQLVRQNMDNALKDSKREASGKLKIASLAIFKELGYSPAEIKDLAESGLI